MLLQERVRQERRRSALGSVQAADQLVELRAAMLRMAQELAELRRENRELRSEIEALRGRSRRMS